MSTDSLTYKDAGVDIAEAAELVGDFGEMIKRTTKKRQLMQSFGLFAASLDLSEYENPVIVTGCDGVGTKLELLLEHDLPEGAGKDLVAMSVNDIITTGADPLMFLDYVGVGKLDKTLIKRVVSGVCDWCEACDCILAGGETAEMPGMVKEGVIELSGFCVGAAEKVDLLDPTSIAPGDVLLGWASNGLHSNGWSLVRRILATWPDEFSQEEIRDLLAPTRLYYDVVTDMRAAKLRPRAYAHITGGGLTENLERLLGDNGAQLNIPKWELGAIPKLLAHVETQEAVSTFNMGFGWVAIVAPEDVDAALKCGEGATVLGEVSGHEVTVKVG